MTEPLEASGAGDDGAASDRRAAPLRLLDAAIDSQHGLVQSYVDRLRGKKPGADSDELCRLLERRFLAALAGAGAAAGAAAAAPGVGTAASLALSAGETAASLDVTALFGLSVAEVRGVRLDDVDRRRTLLLAVLVGAEGPAAVAKAAGRIGPHWARALVDAIPMSAILKVNKVLGARFVTKYGTKQGVLVLGRAAPFGIGVGLGAAGNAALAWSVIQGVRAAFGEAPARVRRRGRRVAEQDEPASVVSRAWTRSVHDGRPLDDRLGYGRDGSPA